MATRQQPRTRMETLRTRQRAATPSQRKARRTRLKARTGNAGLPATIRKRAVARTADTTTTRTRRRS
jgi:hypothetical protein